MKASAIEFRFRMMINLVIITFGFNAPGSASWSAFTGAPRQVSLLEWLPLQLSRAGLASFTAATPAVVAIAAIVAGLGAFLRIWGSAWLGPGIVTNPQMKAHSVLADGPYRYVRNPLIWVSGAWSRPWRLHVAHRSSHHNAPALVLSVAPHSRRRSLPRRSARRALSGLPASRATPHAAPARRSSSHWPKPPLDSRRAHRAHPSRHLSCLRLPGMEIRLLAHGEGNYCHFGVGLIGRALVLGNNKEPVATK